MYSDPTHLLRSKIRVSRSARSDPTPIVKNTPTILPPIVINGAYNGNSITVYGEIHNDIENSFYESLKLENKIVLVEHATVLCEMDLKYLIIALNKQDGSEYIWYKLKSRKKPVICIDNRIEMGLFSSIDEKHISSFKSTNFKDINEIMLPIIKVIKNLESEIIKKEFNITREVYSVYTLSIKTIRKQLKMIYELLKNPASIDFNELFRIKNMLIQNITKIASLMVDINIVNTIKANKEPKDILIFVGAAHAYRLNKYFPNIFNKIVYNSSNVELIEDFKLFLDRMIYDD